MDPNIEGVVMAFTMPLMLASIIIGVLIFLYKSRVRRLDSLVKIVELTGNVDSETVRALGNGRSSYKNDYRSGLIWLAIGIPLTLGLYLEEGMSGAIYGLLPILIALALGISGKYRLRED